MKPPSQASNTGETGTSRASENSVEPSRLQEFLLLCGIGLAYFCANSLALLVPDSARVLAAVWPAGGIGLAALLLNPKRRWRWILVVLFLAGNLSNLMAGRNMLASIGFMLANVLESWACGWLISRSTGPRIFDTVASVRRLLVAATLVNGLTTFIGAATAALFPGAPFWEFYRTWWVADGLGILLVAPFIVTWAVPDHVPQAERQDWYLELAVVTGALWVMAAAYFGTNHLGLKVPPASYMLMVPLAWGAARLGPRGVMTIEGALTVIALELTLKSHGSSPLGGSTETERLLWLQLFLGVTVAISLLLAASFTERTLGEKSLRESEARHRALVEQAPIGIVVRVDEIIVYANLEAARMVGAASPSDLIGRSTREFLTEVEWQEAQERRAKMLSSGQPMGPGKYKLRRLDNTWIDVEARASPIMHQGKPAIQTILVDISEQIRAEALTRRQMTFDDVIKRLLARIVACSGAELDQEIQTSLRELATFMNVSRGFITVISADGATWSMTHEWSAEGLPSHIGSYQGIPLGSFSRVEKLLLDGHVFQIGRLDDLTPEDQDMRAKLVAGGFQAAIQFPLHGRGGHVIGSMGLLSTSQETWREEDVRRLQMAANAMAHAIERRRSDQHLQKSREQLRALTARLQSLREEERIRIAREIHDHLGQLLTALSLDLRLIERKLAGVADAELREALSAKVASARSLGNETIASVQKIATELRPAILDRLGLEAAIEAEASVFAARTGIECRLSLAPPTRRVPTECATACFRIFQEIMTNIARHAQAHQVVIELTCNGGRVLMQVTDDGIGIREADLENPNSLGLLGMMERAETMGGFIIFQQAAPRGTTVAVHLPFPGPASDA